MYVTTSDYSFKELDATSLENSNQIRTIASQLGDQGQTDECAGEARQLS